MNSELFELRTLQALIQKRTQKKKRIFRTRREHFKEWSESEFLMHFRVSKQTAKTILQKIEGKLCRSVERKTNVSSSLQLLIALRYYACGSFQITVGDFGGIHQTTTSKIIRDVSAAIASMYSTYIKSPEKREDVLKTQKGFFKIAKFPRCVGALDCTHIRIQSPGGEFAELFRNRKGFFSYNVQAMCDADLKFSNIVARWPGSTHDSTIFNNSRLKFNFESGSLAGQLMLGDGGYAGYASSSYLMIPLENPRTHAEKLYNESQIRTRNVIERCFGVWKRRFPVLSMGIRTNLATVQDTIIATAILHNICRKNSDDLPPFDNPAQQVNFERSIEVSPRNLNSNTDSVNITRNALIHYFSSL